jgi:pyruvate ferredoxin oxidoreductase gamma subunit
VFQIRIHGRGGQGVVTAAELLSVAAFDGGLHAQAFPSFGSERTGAPVVSFCRLDDKEIRTREPVMTPDALIIQDVTLVHQVDVFAGLAEEGYVLINSSKSFADLGLEELFVGRRAERMRSCPATELARQHLGRPLPNAALLGAFAALTGRISLESLEQAIRERFHGDVGERNAAAAAAAFAAIQSEGSVARATTD